MNLLRDCLDKGWVVCSPISDLLKNRVAGAFARGNDLFIFQISKDTIWDFPVALLKCVRSQSEDKQNLIISFYISQVF